MSALHVSYRMQRGDYVALTTALLRQSWWRPLLIVGLYYAALLCFVMATVGDAASVFDIVHVIAIGQAPWWFYPVLLIGPLLALVRPLFVRLIAARVYPRNAMADQELRLAFNAEAIEGGTPEIHGRYLWSAIRQVVETSEHAFFLISRREALSVPRRAFATPDDYADLMSFVRSRMTATRAP